MKNVSSLRSSFLFSFVFFCIVSSLSGCIATKKQVPSVPVVQHQEEVDKLTKELEIQRNRTAQLQMSLLEKHAEINRLTVMNERLVRDFVRNKATMRNRGNKVETVRLLAEVATLVNTAKESKLTGSRQDLLVSAEQYQAESKIELDKGNFEGASYLANQALTQVRRIQLERSADGPPGDGYMTSFFSPLAMKLLATSNVRKGPSKQTKVQFVVGDGEQVTALGYKGEWVNVEVQGRGKGWIHYSLLSGSRE